MTVDCLAGSWIYDLLHRGAGSAITLSPGDLDEAVAAPLVLGRAEQTGDTSAFDRIAAPRNGVLVGLSRCTSPTSPTSPTSSTLVEAGTQSVHPWSTADGRLIICAVRLRPFAPAYPVLRMAMTDARRTDRCLMHPTPPTSVGRHTCHMGTKPAVGGPGVAMSGGQSSGGPRGTVNAADRSAGPRWMASGTPGRAAGPGRLKVVRRLGCTASVAAATGSAGVNRAERRRQPSCNRTDSRRWTTRCRWDGRHGALSTASSPRDLAACR